MKEPRMTTNKVDAVILYRCGTTLPCPAAESRELLHDE